MFAQKVEKKRVVTRLARVGYDNAVGYLKGSFLSLGKNRKKNRYNYTRNRHRTRRKKQKEINIIDVRKSTEYNVEHIESAKNKPLDDLFNHYKEIDKEKNIIYTVQGVPLSNLYFYFKIKRI